MSKLVIANWKSNKKIAEAQQWVTEFINQRGTDSNQVVLTPPLPFLPVLQWQLREVSHVTLGAQTVSPFPAGSYTGAVSAYNLSDLNISHVIVGHSESRKYLHITSQVVAQQVEQCVLNNFTPVVCVEEQNLAEQAQAIPTELWKKCVVAYEPTNAIGSGNNAPSEEVSEMVDRIKKVFGEVPVLYGGSVNSTDVDEYTSLVDGFIVGTASLDVADFIALLNALPA